MKKEKINAKFFIKLLVSLAFVAWLIFEIDWVSVLEFSKKITLAQIIAYIIFLLLGMAISVYKWQQLAKFKGFRVSFSKCFQLYLAGTLINNVFPSVIGGDTYKAYQLGRDTKKYLSAGSTVIIDRISGLVGAMILTVIFALINIESIIQNKTLSSIIFFIVLALVAVVAFVVMADMGIGKRMFSKLPKKLQEIANDFREYRQRKIILNTLLLSLLFGIIGLAVVNYILFWSMGIKIELLDYLGVIFLISIISSLPISVNNIGIKEWAYVTFFGFFGVQASAVIAVALISRFMQMLLSFFALPFYLKNK